MLRTNSKYNKKQTWSKKKKIIVFTIVVIVLLPVGFVMLMLLQFNGGLQGIKNRITPSPNPTGKSVETKRADSSSFMSAEFQQLEKSKDLKYFAVSKHDVCYRGEANWKRSDNYSNKCSQKITRFYGTNDNLRSQIVKLGDFLEANDWADTGSTKGNTEVEVALFRYDEYYGRPHPVFGNIGYAGQLPSIKGKKDNALVEIKYDESKPETQTFFLNQYTWSGVAGAAYHEIKELQAPKTLFPKILKSYKYVISVSIEDTYFEN